MNHSPILMYAIIFSLIIICCLLFIRCSKRRESKKLEGDLTPYTLLTEEMIDSISDENLVLAIFENLDNKLPRDVDKEYEAVMSWNKPRRSFYIVWWLEAEVNNGGFEQYYINSSGQYYKELPSAFASIGAVKFAALAEKANIVFEEKKDLYNKPDLSAEEFVGLYENSPLNDYDVEFHSLYEEENLYDLLVEYIRKNKNDFVDK